MHKPRVSVWAATAFFWALGASPVGAQGFLGAADVRALIEGNTVEVQRGNGTRYLAYYEPGGIWLRQERGQIAQGAWRVLDDGNQCVAIGRDDSCALIQKNPDGTFTRISNGVAQFTWLKVMPGKGF
ncbi:MAG: hypothetical protein IBJ14_14695 [Hydrogenophaga sp.]|nr:hypothetical protein [Hydrogenophaga sp.]